MEMPDGKKLFNLSLGWAKNWEGCMEKRGRGEEFVVDKKNWGRGALKHGGWYRKSECGTAHLSSRTWIWPYSTKRNLTSLRDVNHPFDHPKPPDKNPHPRYHSGIHPGCPNHLYWLLIKVSSTYKQDFDIMMTSPHQAAAVKIIISIFKVDLIVFV